MKMEKIHFVKGDEIDVLFHFVNAKKMAGNIKHRTSESIPGIIRDGAA